MNTHLESFITITNPDSIDASFDLILDSLPTDSDQNDFVQRTLNLGSALLEAGRRFVRKRSSAHNALVWPLSYDITVKVFSMTDTKSVCNVGATCAFFHKCAMDPLCFADIHLATLVLKAYDAIVSTMIQRAGNELRSIKLGLPDLPPSCQDDSFLLTRACLSSLNGSGGAAGLRRLHLYNIEKLDNAALLASLSVCPSLVDLEIICLEFIWKLSLESVGKHCPSLERLVFDCFPKDEVDSLKISTCSEFLTNCPKITTLALKGFSVPDFFAGMLITGFRKLKFVDFERSYSFTGSFLKNLGTRGSGNTLETLILRDTEDLKKVRVEQFIAALLTGQWRSLRHLDISHSNGLASDHDPDHRLYNTSFIPVTQLSEQRPNLCLVAKFPDEETSSDDSAQYYSEDSTSFSSYSSDQGSDSEDSGEREV